MALASSGKWSSSPSSSSSSSSSSSVDPFLRCLVSVAATVSLVLLARDEQTQYQLAAGDLVRISIDYSFVSGLVFLVYSNGIVAAYTFFVALSSGSEFLTRIRGSKPCTWLLFVLDQAMAYFLLSAVSAASEVLYLTDYGSPKAGWDSKCSVFGKFCNILAISIALSLLAVVLLGTIATLSAKRLFKQHYVKIKSSKASLL